MTTIVTRAGKGSPLTNTEMDANLNNLNDDKVETSVLASYALIASPTLTGTPQSANPSYGDNTAQIATTSWVQTNATGRTGTNGSTKIVTGTTAQRDGSPVIGYTRFNSDTTFVETWDGTSWVSKASTAAACTGNSATATMATQVPRSTTTTTAVATDTGKCIAVSAGITIPTSIFAAGDAVSIYNNSSSPVTITQGSGLTMYLAGTATTGNRTLAQRGIATLWFNSATECAISGAGIT